MPDSILIVDDMKDIRLLIAKTLSKTGFNIIEAESGKDALEIIQEDDSIRLVLLDIMMPDLDGFGVMKAIKDIKAERDLKVCFISGKKDKEAVVQAIQAGGDDYIVKPIYPENLLSKVGILLKKVELIEGYSHVKAKIKAELLGLDIRPDVEIRGVDELSVLLFSTAEIQPEVQLTMISKRLNELIGFDGDYSLKVNKCRREGVGKYFVRSRFVGLPESIAKEIRSLAIKGTFLS